MIFFWSPSQNQNYKISMTRLHHQRDEEYLKKAKKLNQLTPMKGIVLASPKFLEDIGIG